MPTISGTVYDDAGAPAAGRIVRAYRRDTGALLGEEVTSDGVTPIILDPHYANVSLLLHFDGANGSTTFTDNSTAPKTISVNGNAQVSTAQSKFGGAALLLDGDGDRLTVAAHSDMGFGAGDFTAEGWFYPSSSNTGNRFLLDMRVAGGSSYVLWCSQSSAPNRLCFTDEGGGAFVYGGSWNVGAWNSWALTRASDIVRGFINGAIVFTTTDSRTYASSQGCYIGSGASASQGAIGYMDELRISKGVARYVAAYTPAAVPFYDAAEFPATPAGSYGITTAYTGEVQRIVLDDDAGTLYNDLIDRVVLA